MNETTYDSADIKKIVGWLEAREQKMKNELAACGKKNSKKCRQIQYNDWDIMELTTGGQYHERRNRSSNSYDD